MKWLLPFAAVACNQVFGLKQTDPSSSHLPVDAQQFDTPADAPFACPLVQTMPPAFSPYFHQIVARGKCMHYSTSTPTANLALAKCTIGADAVVQVIEESGIDSNTLTPSDLQPNTQVRFGYGKLAPDGGELWVNRQDTTTSVATISVYRRSGASWTYGFDVFTLPAVDGAATVSTPMRGLANRTVLYIGSSPVTIHELVENPPGTWTETRAYQASDFGVKSLGDSVNLSPDGLRVVFTGYTLGVISRPAVLYADRISVGDPFGGASVIAGPPEGAETPFMTEDCSKLYFSGLNSVLYVPQ